MLGRRGTGTDSRDGGFAHAVISRGAVVGLELAS